MNESNGQRPYLQAWPPLTKLNQAARSTLKATGNVEIDGAHSQQEEDPFQAVIWVA